MTFQNQHSFIKALIWIALLCKYQLALSNPCQVYPSEYAYLESSVDKSERTSANCMRYQPNSKDQGLHYTHCDGTQLRLTDSDFGSEQYSSSDYYAWKAGSGDSQLLFIFPTRVILTTITLHYYSDNVRGLPRLRFYAVPDDFDVWDAPLAGYSHVDIAAVPLGGEPAGRRNVSINVNFTTTKVLMYRVRSAFQFTVSEVEFFIITLCNETTTSTAFPSSQPTKTVPISSTNKSMTSNPPQHQHTAENLYTSKDSSKEATTSQSDSDSSQQSENNLNLLLAGVTVTALIVVVGISVLVVLLLLWRKKRIQKNKMNCNLGRQDGLYSTLDRGTKQQMQPQSLDSSNGLYDQIQLSPSTGQSELISKIECPTNHTSLTLSHNHKKEEHHETEIETSKSEYATYAVVDKRKTKKKSKNNKSSESQKNSVCGAVHSKESSKVEKPKDYQNERKENLEDMYAVVQKKSKKHEEQVIGETAPPVPSHTIECLYTAVQKKPK